MRGMINVCQADLRKASLISLKTTLLFTSITPAAWALAHAQTHFHVIEFLMAVEIKFMYNFIRIRILHGLLLSLAWWNQSYCCFLLMHDNLEIVAFMHLLVEFMLWNGGESYFMDHCLFLPVWVIVQNYCTSLWSLIMSCVTCVLWIKWITMIFAQLMHYLVSTKAFNFYLYGTDWIAL